MQMIKINPVIDSAIHNLVDPDCRWLWQWENINSLNIATEREYEIKRQNIGNKLIYSAILFNANHANIHYILMQCCAEHNKFLDEKE